LRWRTVPGRANTGLSSALHLKRGLPQTQTLAERERASRERYQCGLSAFYGARRRMERPGSTPPALCNSSRRSQQRSTLRPGGSECRISLNSVIFVSSSPGVSAVLGECGLGLGRLGAAAPAAGRCHPMSVPRTGPVTRQISPSSTIPATATVVSR